MTDTTCDFGSLRVTYDHRVIAPRTWTLLQSDWAVELSAVLPHGPILELCAGAGHIGLAAATRTGRALVQVEADAVAADFARRNAAAASFTAIDVRCGLMLDAVSAPERFPLILADPPYLPTADIAQFPDDPPRAIDGGADGLDGIRMCLLVVEAHLAEGGASLIQVRGATQARDLARLASAGLRVVATRSVDDERAVVQVVRVGDYERLPTG